LSGRGRIAHSKYDVSQNEASKISVGLGNFKWLDSGLKLGREKVIRR
jgi:hypothetical protein